MIAPKGQQIVALAAVEAWLRKKGKKRFVLGGWAGSGKTSLIPHIQRMVNRTSIVTYTNKAALVLRCKGIESASTIHRLMYKLEDEATMTWSRLTSLTERTDLIIVDEASMVSERVRADLERYGVPVLYVGDPFQLPPVNEDGSIMERPDYLLTEVHRHGDVILDIATAIREGRRYPDVDQHGVSDAELCTYEQVICHSNAARHRLNARIRKHRGLIGPPKEGERLVLAKTDYDRGIYAGELGTITRADGYALRVLFDGQDDDMAFGYYKMLDLGETAYAKENKGRVCFDFGYAITCHKAQGSQFNSVLYWDERTADARHRYTGATRAVKRLTMAGF